MLALSSAGGSAPFDSALRRYVDFLTADGQLEVDLEIAGRRSGWRPTSRSRSSASSRRGSPTPASTRGRGTREVRIEERAGERFVTVVDDGSGFDEQEIAAGQGLKNMRARAASIGGGFRLSLGSGPGNGAGSRAARLIYALRIVFTYAVITL